MKRPLSTLLSFRSVLVSSLLIPPTLGLRRTVGPPNDPRFMTASKACDGSDRNEFEHGVCSLLITCIYEKLNEDVKASLSSGTNIVSLLPTILVLIGMLNSCCVPYSSFACSTLKRESTSRTEVPSDHSVVPRFTASRAREAGFPLTAPSTCRLLL